MCAWVCLCVFVCVCLCVCLYVSVSVCLCVSVCWYCPTGLCLRFSFWSKEQMLGSAPLRICHLLNYKFLYIYIRTFFWLQTTSTRKRIKRHFSFHEWYTDSHTQRVTDRQTKTQTPKHRHTQTHTQINKHKPNEVSWVLFFFSWLLLAEMIQGQTRQLKMTGTDTHSDRHSERQTNPHTHTHKGRHTQSYT